MMIKSTAKHSIIRGCLSRYELVINSASKITTSLDKQTFYNDKSDKDDDSDDSHYNFIISDHITTLGNGYRTLHNSIFRQSSGTRGFNI